MNVTWNISNNKKIKSVDVSDGVHVKNLHGNDVNAIISRFVQFGVDLKGFDRLLKAHSEMQNVIDELNSAIVHKAHIISTDEPTADAFIQALGHIIHSHMQKESNSRRCDPFPMGTSLSEMIDEAVKLIPTSGDVVPVDVQDSDLGRVHVPTALPINMLPMVAAMRSSTRKKRQRQLELSSAI